MTGRGARPGAVAAAVDRTGAVDRTDTAAPYRAETRRSARNGAVGLAGAAVSGLFGFVLTVVVTRGFGTTGAGGFFSLVGIVTVTGAVCCLGADTGLIWALPRRRAGTGAGRTLTVAMVPALLVAAAVAVAGLLAAPLLAPHLLDSAGAARVPMLRCAFGAVPAAVAMTLLLAAVRALRPIRHYVAVQFLLLPVARPVLVGAAALAGAGLLAGIVGWLLPIVLAAVVCAVLLVRPREPRSTPEPRSAPESGAASESGARGAPGADRAHWRLFWGFAAPRSLSAAIDSASMWVGVLLTTVLAGQTEAGVFGAVGRYVLAGQLAMQGLRVAVAPQLSRLLAAGRTADAALVHRQTTGWVIVLSWPVYLLLACFGPGFLRLFGAGFTTGSAALTVLALAMLVNVGLGNVQTLLLMSGGSRAHLVATLAGLTVNVAGGIALIPAFGALGAACSWAAGIVLENVVAAVAARRALGEPLLTARLLRAAGATGAGVGLLCLAVALPVGRGVTGLLLTLALLAATVVALLGVPRVRRALRDVLAAVRAGRAAGDPSPGRR